jgi:hypothetical protein
MQNVIYGALGVLVVLGLLALGFFMGWKARVLWVRHTHRAVSEEISEQERRELRAHQKAFDGLMSYNVETAYGMNPSLDELTKEGVDD